MSILGSTAGSSVGVSAMSTVVWELIGLCVFLGVVGYFLVKMKKIRDRSVHELVFMGSVALGQKERIAVVRFCGKKLLLGITAQQISTLAALEDAPFFDATLKKTIDAQNSETVDKVSTPCESVL